MPKYKVVNHGSYPVESDQPDYHAAQMQEEYGLWHIPVKDIYRLWSEYSDSMAAGWLYASKESIESVFNVELEEIKDGSDQEE